MVWKQAGRKRGERGDYDEEQLALVEERRTDVQDVHLCENRPVNKSALYRRVITEENLSSNEGPNFSTAGKETDIGATAIRNVETEGRHQTKNNEDHVCEHDPSAKPKPPNPRKRKSAAATKQAERINGYTEEELGGIPKSVAQRQQVFQQSISVSSTEAKTMPKSKSSSNARAKPSRPQGQPVRSQPS